MGNAFLADRRFLSTLTVISGACAAGFSGFYGGRAWQMTLDLGDGVDWWLAREYVSVAMALFASAAAFGIVFLYLTWTTASSSTEQSQ